MTARPDFGTREVDALQELTSIGCGAALTALGAASARGQAPADRAAILATMAIAYLLLRSAQRIGNLLGRTGIAILERVFGLILAAIAVQFMFDGAKELWR